MEMAADGAAAVDQTAASAEKFVSALNYSSTPKRTIPIKPIHSTSSLLRNKKKEKGESNNAPHPRYIPRRFRHNLRAFRRLLPLPRHPLLRLRIRLVEIPLQLFAVTVSISISYPPRSRLRLRRRPRLPNRELLTNSGPPRCPRPCNRRKPERLHRNTENNHKGRKRTAITRRRPKCKYTGWNHEFKHKIGMSFGCNRGPMRSDPAGKCGHLTIQSTLCTDGGIASFTVHFF